MLSAKKKAQILAAAGISVPEFPDDKQLQSQTLKPQQLPGPFSQQKSDEVQMFAVTEWIKTIELLYVEYAAARAARSLREAEEIRQLDILRRANSRNCTKR